MQWGILPDAVREMPYFDVYMLLSARIIKYINSDPLKEHQPQAPMKDLGKFFKIGG